MTNKKGPCEKCTKRIPVDAQRCPRCGYEPGKPVLGPIGTILGALLLLGAVFQILGGVLILFTVFVGVPITSALLGGGIFIAAGGFQAAIADWFGKFGTHYAAEQPDNTTIQDEEESFKQALEEGQQRGEDIGDRYRERIDQISPWVFTSFIIAGAGFVFLVFIIIGAETEVAGAPSEDLFLIPFIMSIAILGFTVLADVGRVNRVYETDHKWWIWSPLSMIPLIGFLGAFVWVWKRRKAEKAAEG